MIRINKFIVNVSFILYVKRYQEGKTVKKKKLEKLLY